MYTKDSGGYLPAYEDGWIAPIAAMGKLKVDPDAPPANQFQCPSQPFVGFGGRPAAATWRGSHYGINQHLASRLTAADGSALPLWAQVNRATIKDPAAKVLMADASGGNYAGVPDRDPTIAGISRFGRSVADAYPPEPAQPFPYHRHLGGNANFLMLDGHVEQRVTWPTITVGPGTYGFRTWHAEHVYPGSGHDMSETPDE
jgi:prepilin-type processing-associated H-X9-DG protein